MVLSFRSICSRKNRVRPWPVPLPFPIARHSAIDRSLVSLYDAPCRRLTHFAHHELVLVLLGNSCRDGSRLVASCRDNVERTQFLNLCDVPRDRQRRHQVLVAECRGYLRRVEMTTRAIALQGSDGAGVTRNSVAFRNRFDRKSEVVVAGCRCLSHLQCCPCSKCISGRQ